MKALTICENPSSNPLQTACCGIQEAARDSVNCSGSQEMILNHVTVLLFIISVRLLKVRFFKGWIEDQNSFESGWMVWGGGDSAATSGKTPELLMFS